MSYPPSTSVVTTTNQRVVTTEIKKDSDTVLGRIVTTIVKNTDSSAEKPFDVYVSFRATTFQDGASATVVLAAMQDIAKHFWSATSTDNTVAKNISEMIGD